VEPGKRDSSQLKDLRRKLRNFGTPAEAVLWKNLKCRQLDGKKFRRQTSLGPYIVDFFCHDCGLIVELDGAPHFSMQGGEIDAKRTAYLEGMGLTVLRIENKHVFENIEGVLETIRVGLRTTSPGKS